LDRGKKEILVDDMKGRLAKARATFLVNYQGIDVETLNSIRRELQRVNTEFRVVKNRLLKRASQDTQTACIQEHFVGPCAVAVTYEDVVGPAKILVDRDKKLQHLKLKVGQIGGKAIGVEDIKRLAELPSREVLLSQVLAAMQGVPTSLVRVLNGVVLKLLYALKSIEEQKSDSGNQ
jgi:large subunit ribosomal protein L10